MKPYYEHGGIVIFHGDCREVLPTIAPDSVDLLLTDPPYGRGKADRFGSRDNLIAASPYMPVVGDDEPFNPTHLLRYPRLILWGANWYADRLPPSSGWIVWDKKDGGNSDNFGDAELAWTNVTGATRLFHHKWRGMIKASEQSERRVHPTQKPVALMQWLIELFTKQGDLVLDPYMGSGPVLKACKRLGRRAIGIETEEPFCEIAAKRLAQECFVFELDPPQQREVLLR